MQYSGGKRYNNYSTYIKEYFGGRVQKISVNTGFSCPNRDGTKGTGGCTYCNIASFSPLYSRPVRSVRQQLDAGIDFFSKKYKSQRYLAYFQAYTNTYAELDLLKELYLEALSHERVIGLVIGTRPDCINEELLSFLEKLAKDYYISLEFGVESTLNRTLRLVNRCHTYEETIEAFDMAKGRGIKLGAHLILGLPGESREDMLGHAAKLSKLPLDFLKLHQLQILKGTKMAKQYEENPGFFPLFSPEEYIRFVAKFITLLRPDIILQRFISESPLNMLVAPNWNGMKNFEIIHKIDKYLEKHDLWQGKNYSS